MLEAQRVVEVAIGVVREPQAGRVLICRRKAEQVLGGYWEFPGGKCHAGELPADCVRREVEEETGLVVAVERELPIIEHTYPHARVRLHPFVCRTVGGKLELREVAEARWVAPHALGEYRFPEANEGLIKSVAAGAV